MPKEKTEEEQAKKKKAKKRWGDRRDGTRIRDFDAMHSFMPYMLGDRIGNEAVMNDEVETDAILRFLEKKNAEGDDFKYTIFHVVVAALAKAIYLRPAMNRFIIGHRYFDRNRISFSFTAKRSFADHSEEFLVILKVDPESGVSPLEQVHAEIKRQVNRARNENKQDGATDAMDVLNKLPRFMLRIVMKVLIWLDYHGHLPKSMLEVDPYHTTCFVSNLGSIKMSASYHHLANWGTNSFFVLIGEKKLRPVIGENGEVTVKEMLPMGYTIDERIADGFYFCKSVKLLRYLLRNPEILDQPIDTPVDWTE